MKCPFCNHMETKVIDSRAKDNGKTIRRRRECLSCEKRFTTREEVDQPLLLVVKSDGRREPFDRSKLKQGLLIACTKRPITSDTIESIVSNVEAQLHETGHDEINSKDIGTLVMISLKSVDEVAYVRFASVYRQFKNKEEFVNELNALK